MNIDKDNIIAGIEPGGMNDIYEIKVLICYLLSQINRPMSSNDFNTVFHGNRWVNYFSYCEALAELLTSGHLEKIKTDEGEVYSLKELGYDTAHQLKLALPSSLREKIVDFTLNMYAKQKLDKEREADIVTVDDGYLVNCAVHDIGSDLINISIFAPDLEMAKRIKMNFLNNTDNIYKAMIGFFTMDKQSILEVLEDDLQ